MIAFPDVWNDVREALADMRRPLRLVHFSSPDGCEFCEETLELLSKLTALSDKLELESHSADEEIAFRYLVNKTPATVIAAERDYGICFYGFPFGFEFAALLDILLLVSRGECRLQRRTMQFLEELDEPLHLQTFVTPGCHYCPGMVMVANQLAYASDKVMANTIEAMEFPDLVARYGIRGVPHIVVNETQSIVGAMSESEFISRLVALRANR
jgi:glutaredoxin-like protein